jgi:hypothetical protein
MATILGKGSHPNNPGMISCGREYISSVNRHMPAKASRCLPREFVRETSVGMAAAPAMARLSFVALRLNNTPGLWAILADPVYKISIRSRSLTFNRRR